MYNADKKGDKYRLEVRQPPYPTLAPSLLIISIQSWNEGENKTDAIHIEENKPHVYDTIGSRWLKSHWLSKIKY